MISVIIPAWNEEKTLPSLLCQLCEEPEVEEVIVADAHSTDGTRALVESFGMRVVDGGMPGVGRNAGARVAQGDWLLFLDADSQLRGAHWCARALREARMRGLEVMSASVWPLPPASFVDWLFHGVYNVYMRLIAPFSPHVTGACLLVKREVFIQSSGFRADIPFAEDVEWAGRASRIAPFGLLRAVSIGTSVRRLQKEGRWTFAKKYLKAEWAILRKKKIAIDYNLKQPRL